MVVVDVDEVLAMFMRGFEKFLGGHGLEMRIERFALFQNIFRPGEAEHLDVAAGRQLFEAFFEHDVEDIDPAPGAREALDLLAARASIVILTNAPQQSRAPRARWLVKNGFDYPFVINAGPKGAAVAAITAKSRGKAAFIDDLLPNLDWWRPWPPPSPASRWSPTNACAPSPIPPRTSTRASTTGRSWVGRSRRRSPRRASFPKALGTP